MTTPRRLALATATALSAALLVPAAPAQASRQPIKNTAYTGSVQSGDTLVTATTRIGSSKAKVKRFTFEVTCPEGSVKKTFRNLKIVDSSFGRDVGGVGFAADYNIRGVWFSKHKLNVILYVNKQPCATQVDFYTKG